MSDPLTFAELQRALAAANLERDEERRQRQNAEQALQQAQEETRHTTLDEYLRLCHEHLSETISVQTNKALCTQGDPSNAKGKVRPDFIKPWEGFIDTQKETLESLYAVYPSDDMLRCLDNRNYIRIQGEKVAAQKLSSEQELVKNQRDTVETPVTAIIAHLKSLDPVRKEFGLAKGVEFYNHLNPLNENALAAELARKVADQQALEPSTPHHLPPSISYCKPDQVCVYTSFDNGIQPTLVVEYKAPHKVTLDHLRHVLRHDRDPIELEKIINGSPSQDTKGHFEYFAERMVAAVITQTFSYMVGCGTEYGYVSTAEAFIFLRIKPEEDAKTVYFHLAVPNADVKAQKEDFPGTDPYRNQTAISQVLAFSLCAINSVQTPCEWRERVTQELETWEVDYEAVLRQIPETPEAADKSSPFLSEYIPKTYNLVVPKGTRRIRNRLRSSKATHNDSATQNHQGTPPSSDDESSPSITPTRPHGAPRSKQAPRGQRSQRSSAPTGATSSSRGGQRRAFCTQLCLQGLAQGGALDRQCPNVSNHCKGGYEGDKHQLGGEEFRILLGEQLRRGRGNACQPLWMQGARGALFRLTLISHGYTVVGKGTITAYIKELRHEAEVYQRLVALQAIHIPICLGSIDLDQPFYYDDGVRIMHFMLLSWAGECLDESKTAPSTDRQTWTSDLVRAVSAIHGAGVLHQDIRMPNLLWNEETKRVMVIDFEGAEIVKAKAVRQALAPISPNRKRKRAVVTKEDNNMLAVMSEDPKIRYQADLEVSRTRGLGRKALRTIQESAGLGLT